MAKNNSKKSVNERIKKINANNEWFRNATKSFGLVTKDVIASIMPDTASTIDWNAEVMMNSMDMIKTIRDNNGIRNAFGKQFANLPQVKASKLVIKNALDDFKTGNIYNEARMLNGGFDDSGFDDFGDGPTFIDDDFSDGPTFIDDDDGGSVDTSVTTSNKTPVTIINTMPLAKSISASTEATISTMTSIAEQQFAVETEKAMFTERHNGIMLNALSSINDNLALLVQFNSDSTTQYHAAATEYYKQSIELLQNIESSGKTEEKEIKKSKVHDMFTSSGGIKLDEYLKRLKTNMIDIKDLNPMIGTIIDQVLDVDFISGLALNPIGTLLPMVIESFLSTNLKNVVGKFDKRINSIAPAILARINSFNDNENPFLDGLNKVFGTNVRAKKSVYLNEYEKGTITWDGESKKALVEVIPTYLRRIESALTGREERIFDYDEGVFVSQKRLQKQFDEKLERAKTSGYTALENEIYNIIRNIDLTHDERKQFDKDLKEYLSKMTDKGMPISHIIRKNSEGEEIDDFSEYSLFDRDTDRIEFMRKVLSGVDPTVLTEAALMGIQDSINTTNKFYDDIRENTHRYGYSALNNNLDDDGIVKFDGLKAGGLRDIHGLSQLDYLRDIRSALVRGIRVFPLFKFNGPDGDGKNIPNNDLLNKINDEEKRHKEKLKSKHDNKLKHARWLNTGKTMSQATIEDNATWDKYYGEERKHKQFNTDTKRGKALQSISDMNEKLDGVLFEILYGDEDFAKRYLNKIIDYSKTKKPLITLMTGMFGDTIKAFKSYFTGQGYITSDGVEVKGKDGNMLDKIFGFFIGIKDKLTKGKDGEDGLLQKMTKDFMAGFEKFKVNLFGEKFLSEHDAKETFSDLTQKVKERLPKSLGYGLGAGMVKTFFASQLGLLGNFLLPGGPMGAVLTGTALGFLRQSETFNRVMFGEMGENGKRLGGIISQELQDKYAEFKGSIKPGIGIGILGSLLLPGGPILGSMLGIGSVMAAKSQAFQEFMYGKDFDVDNKSLMGGVFGNLFKKLSGNENPELATFLGTTGLSVGIAQGVGLLPAFLLPGGPIIGAMM